MRLEHRKGWTPPANASEGSEFVHLLCVKCKYEQTLDIRAVEATANYLRDNPDEGDPAEHDSLALLLQGEGGSW